MEFLLYGTVGALGVAGVFGYKMFATYNRLMALDERCNTAYADIDVLMKHRHTLLPGLLETVKGYLKHETDILDKLLSAREAALKATKQNIKLEAEAKLSKTIMSVINAGDSTPELKASSHFQQFKNELVDIENRVTASRRFFNVTVEEFNATVRQFPANVIAAKTNLGKREHFNLGTERMLMDDAVKVDFSV